jgi:hypothetical protein
VVEQLLASQQGLSSMELVVIVSFNYHCHLSLALLSVNYRAGVVTTIRSVVTTVNLLTHYVCYNHVVACILFTS